jgi:hypothetical protein
MGRFEPIDRVRAKVCNRRILVIARRSGEGLLTETTAAAQPWGRELVETLPEGSGIGPVTREPILIYIAGIVVFIAGLTIVQRHNIWSGGWPVVVTVFGWFVLLGGLVRMLFPVQLAHVAAGVVQAPGVLPGAAIVQLLFGIFFWYEAYNRD